MGDEKLNKLAAIIMAILLSSCVANAQEKEHIFQVTIFKGDKQETFITRQMQPDGNGGIIVGTEKGVFIWHGDYLIIPIEMDKT